MIHYHGLPITPESVLPQAMQGAHFFLSFENPEQLSTVVEIGSSFAVDNGAFSRWKAGEAVTDWRPFYEWVATVRHIPSFDFAVIPDAIEGEEADNDRLLAEWPFPGAGSPVWHLHESLGRLDRLCGEYGRVCLGSSGAYAKIGTPDWWRRMNAAMKVCCDKDGAPKTKLHGLRMMDVELVRRFPFKSADSTNVARNIGIDVRWNGSYQPPTKAARAAVIRARIEAAQSPSRWTPIEESLELQLT